MMEICKITPSLLSTIASLKQNFLLHKKRKKKPDGIYVLSIICIVFICIFTSTEKVECSELGGKISVPVILDSNEPYYVKDDIIIEASGELVIRPGVQMIFAPSIGITVFGNLLAEGTSRDRIVMRSSLPIPRDEENRLTTLSLDNEAQQTNTVKYTTIQHNHYSPTERNGGRRFVREIINSNDITPNVRLMEGETPLEGRLQIYHRGNWRSICSNSRNWTAVDMNIVCKELGFTGGEWYHWHEHLNDTKQMLLEKPGCVGLERQIKDCGNWNGRSLGGGVCDHHPNLGIRCSPFYKFPSKVEKYWRGIRFENAKHRETYIHDNTLRIKESLSSLKYLDIFHSGVGNGYNSTSGIEIIGVPPLIHSVKVQDSAYNGINITNPGTLVHITNSTIKNNRGFGIYVNSSYRGVNIDSCHVMSNGNDGIRYHFHDAYPDQKLDGLDVFDLCTTPTTLNQIYPIRLLAEQSERSPLSKNCSKRFTVRSGYVISIHFPYLMSKIDNGGEIIIYDGHDSRGNLLWKSQSSIKIKNDTFPQSVTSTRENIYIEFKAKPMTELKIYIDLVAGKGKDFELKVSNSQIRENNGRGIAVENIRSQFLLESSSIRENSHFAGVQVLGGSGFVNISSSEIIMNIGDGVNITYGGGAQNITKSIIRANTKKGIAIWYNETSDRIPAEQDLSIEYSEISRNYDYGVFVGNFCGKAVLNISGNLFSEGKRPSLKIETCWNKTIQHPFGYQLKLIIGHNRFLDNEDFGIKIVPLLNVDAIIEHNYFTRNRKGCLLINGVDQKELEDLPAKVEVSNNVFEGNYGLFVASLGLNHFSQRQRLIFTQNFIRYNTIEQVLATYLNPRSRVSAVIVISSSNVEVYRNIIQNPDSRYEIGSHFQDQSFELNCTYNWLGSNEEKDIYYRIFDRKDRFNLAKIIYIPFLLNPTDPNTEIVMSMPLFVPTFDNPEKIIGGEVTGRETLYNGEYKVVRDISIRPGGRLQISFGVTLKFLPSVGIMIGGQFHAEGFEHADGNMVKFTLFDTGRANATDSNVRLVGGRTRKEGRLQVRMDNNWGSVCNYNFDIISAGIACRQMGFVVNPQDWLLERFEIPQASPSEQVVLSNLKCTQWDNDITKCEAERSEDIENSCNLGNVVGIRCYDTSWAGIRMAITSEKSVMKYVLVEKAGLLDPHTNEHKPAVQMDFSHHVLENVRISDNTGDGLGIIYSDIYFPDNVNFAKNCEFSRNLGNGVLFRQLGMQFRNCLIENNKGSGIMHDPAILRAHQREMAGWITVGKKDHIEYLPFNFRDLWLSDETHFKYIITKSEPGINEVFNIIAQDQNYVISMQLLNPVHNESTEEIIIYDRHDIQAKSYEPNYDRYNYDKEFIDFWSVKRDGVTFPQISSSYGITIWYKSGQNPKGNIILLLRAIRAPDNLSERSGTIQDLKYIPRLKIFDTKIRYNGRGISALHYNRYENEYGDIFLRKANESIDILRSEISFNYGEAFYAYTPFREIYSSNISEITFTLNSTTITDNGKGILQYSKDLRSSNNIYHWILRDNQIERNKGGGFQVSLPYNWLYNENHTHSVYLENITFRHNQNFLVLINGHFSKIKVLKSIFENNICNQGVFTLSGMEKEIFIFENDFSNNEASYIIQFDTDSQSDILGQVRAYFIRNRVKDNRVNPHSHFKGQTSRILLSNSTYQPMSYALGLKGLQRVNVTNNLFGNNQMDFELLAGIKTAKLENSIKVIKNWWGTSDPKLIKKRIFDFDDWNSYAIAIYRPFLLQDHLDSPISTTFEPDNDITIDNLGGRLFKPLILYNRRKPYVIKSDLTIMPEASLSIQAGVELEFFPSVGILALGPIIAQGMPESTIKMRPISLEKKEQMETTQRNMRYEDGEKSVRLCAEEKCETGANQGFLEFYNKTTLQWLPLCDNRFTERNAEVVCKELGFDQINVFLNFDRRIEFYYRHTLNSNPIERIRKWPEPFECHGDENSLNECPVRMNGQLYAYNDYPCFWDDKYVFIHCGQRNLERNYEYWGGIRFAKHDFEQHLFEERMHDSLTHKTHLKEESILEWVEIIGAGILHNEKSPALLVAHQSPFIRYVNISKSASHAISIISAPKTMRITRSFISDNLGIGFTALSLTGEAQHSDSSSFYPLKHVELPYGVFGMLDICDTNKEIVVEERVLLYYKYDNFPVDCVKIFKSVYNSKNLGFRLLSMNLFNSTGKPWPADYIKLIDGDVYNTTTEEIAIITMDGEPNTFNKFYTTNWPSISVIMHATGATGLHGFIAEILTLPISPHGVDRHVQHNVSYSFFQNNSRGAYFYGSAGEISPMVTLEKNRFEYNCEQLYGNFSTCENTIRFDVQNMQNIYFTNNLVRHNQGGLHIIADSSGSATSLKGFIYNNVFENNSNREILHVEGKRSSPFQEITFYRNIVTRNNANFADVVNLAQVVSNLTENYFYANRGEHIMEISGFEKVRLPIYQSCTHNSFFMNEAIGSNYGDYEDKATIIAGSTGQQYVDNIFVNPANSYELVTVNKSSPRAMSYEWSSAVDARQNWWGYVNTIAVLGRIRDENDNKDLLRVLWQPYRPDNTSLLSGKCPPGYTLVGDTCYMYVGGYMNFTEAKDFCKKENASMPYVDSNYYAIINFLRNNQEEYDYYDRIWVQDVDRYGQCTMFVANSIQITECYYRLPFICETDPKVNIDPLAWTSDSITIGAMVATFLALVLIVTFIIFWYTKSKQRKVERLERRNSIRTSIRSSRSFTSMGSLSEAGYRKRMAEIVASSQKSLNQMNGHTNNNISNYSKMKGGESFDSIGKTTSNFNSFETRSYEYDTQTANTAISATTSEFDEGYSRHPMGISQPFKNGLQGVNVRAVTMHDNNKQYDLSFHNQNYRDTPSIGSSIAQEYCWDSSPNIQSNGHAIKYKNTNNASNSNNNEIQSRSFGSMATSSTVPLSSFQKGLPHQNEQDSPKELNNQVNQQEMPYDQISKSYDPLQYYQQNRNIDEEININNQFQAGPLYYERNNETPTMSYKEIEMRDIANGKITSISQPNLLQEESGLPTFSYPPQQSQQPREEFKFGDSRVELGEGTQPEQRVKETSLDDLDQDFELDVELDETNILNARTYMETNVDDSNNGLPSIRTMSQFNIPTTISHNQDQMIEEFKALSSRSKSMPLETEM